jgi:hypothetical protein
MARHIVTDVLIRPTNKLEFTLALFHRLPIVFTTYDATDKTAQHPHGDR